MRTELAGLRDERRRAVAFRDQARLSRASIIPLLMTEQTFFFQAEDGIRDAIDILSIIETLEASNTPAAVAAVNAAGTNAVAQCVYRALWSRLLVIVTRASARSLS